MIGLLSVQVEAPFKPVIKNDTDVSYFDTDFTSEEPELTPPEEGMCRSDLLKVLVTSKWHLDMTYVLLLQVIPRHMWGMGCISMTSHSHLKVDLISIKTSLQFLLLPFYLCKQCPQVMVCMCVCLQH